VTLRNTNFAEKLGLKGQPKEFSLVTVNGSCEIQKGQEVSLTVKGLHLHKDIELKNVWTADTLQLPKGSASSLKGIEDGPHLTGIDLLQIESDEILLLIGSDFLEAQVYDKKRGERGHP